MMTFLPYPDNDLTASTLDRSRLGNQAYCECKVLVNGLWPNHPISRMWMNFEGRSYAGALATYMRAMLDEYNRQSHQRGGLPSNVHVVIPEGCDLTLPPWYGDERVHSTHRSALLYKNYQWYSRFNWSEVPKFEYYYPRSEFKPLTLDPSTQPYAFRIT